jgi:hypothetical protein
MQSLPKRDVNIIPLGIVVYNIMFYKPLKIEDEGGRILDLRFLRERQALRTDEGVSPSRLSPARH